MREMTRIPDSGGAKDVLGQIKRDTVGSRISILASFEGNPNEERRGLDEHDSSSDHELF